jgi:hypothetical protein
MWAVQVSFLPNPVMVSYEPTTKLPPTMRKLIGQLRKIMNGA